MAYTINKYDTTQLTVVQDGTIDQTTDIKLVGKNYAGYGEIQNENFVFLLENFAGANQPPRAVKGQVWFDSANSKLKFYDGAKWRTTGGAEISATAPAGLSQGDFWWDTTNQQLYAYNGTDFVLVGPQDAGSGITQMQSKTVRDTGDISRSIIAATVNDEVIFIISPVEFTINSTDAENAISGFDVVRQGVTLKNTQNATAGVTSTDHQFHGTASNALKLNGIDASNYVTASTGVPTVFTEITNFQTDAGIAIGAGLDLKIFIENDNEGVIQNSQGDEIKFRVKETGGASVNVVDIRPGAVLPGIQSTGPTVYKQVDLGSSTAKFQNIYVNDTPGSAGKIYGISEKAESLIVGGTARTGAVDSAATGTGNSVAVRDAAGNLNAVLFQGTSTSARYADLAEKYTTDSEYPVGTAMCVGGEEETTACKSSSICIGVISEKPAHLMNADAEGQAIGLKGRLPVRVKGTVKKGDAVYAWEDGVCSTIATSGLVGIALEASDTEDEKLIECVLKV
tara:strand:+ start:942 stop:2471 length:1530 start_codon:yes stop_codon:yes gene_type:complete